MRSEVASGSAVGDVRLYVVDEKEIAVAEVREDGTEAKLGGGSRPAKKSIAGAAVSLHGTSAPYTGSAQAGAVRSVVLGGVELAEGRDYAVTAESGVDAGTYGVTVSGVGGYEGSVRATFTITRAPQMISARNCTVTFKGKKSGGKRALAKTRTVKLKSKAKVRAGTAVRYKKANKAGGKKITVNKKTGKVTLKKGLKAGTYKVKVRLTAAAGRNYEAAKAKTIRLTVKVR